MPNDRERAVWRRLGIWLGETYFPRCRLAYDQVDQGRLRSTADWAALGSGKGSDVGPTLSVQQQATCLYGREVSSVHVLVRVRVPCRQRRLHRYVGSLDEWMHGM